MENKRSPGLDIIRCLAILFVILLHSVTYLNLMDLEHNSVSWLASLFMRELSYTCVPLFMLLSGYLQKNKKPEMSFYKGIFPLYLSYGVISVLTLAALAIYNKTFVLDPIDAFYRVINFTANDYAWYFEMFIGLFLLIPFLNIMYNNIPSKKAKLILIFSLGFLTLMPSTIIGFAPYYADNAGIALNIFPDYFNIMYPITYYIVGAFISEYKPYISKYLRLPLVLLATLIPTAITALFTYSRGGYAWYMLNGFQNVCVCLTAIVIFLSVYDIDIKSKPLCFVFKHISLCSFEMYLLSFIFDGFVYSQSAIPKALMPILVFALSFASAFILRLLLSPINNLINKLFSKAKQSL